MIQVYKINLAFSKEVGEIIGYHKASNDTPNLLCQRFINKLRKKKNK